MDPPVASPPSPADGHSRWQAAAAATVQAFHGYATWLAGLSWKRFLLYALLLLVAMSILQKLPPFSWRVTETITERPRAELPMSPAAPQAPTPPRRVIKIEKPEVFGNDTDGVEISIDERGVRIRQGKSQAAASTVDTGASAPAVASAPQGKPGSDVPTVTIGLPPGADSDTVREAVEEARSAVIEAIKDAEEARRDATQAASDATGRKRERERIRVVDHGDPLTDLAFLWIVASAFIKGTYKGRMQAEVKAAQATEVAESESLKRQVIEARMAAMQAQVEPHFLFNTLASIDHLIETDPARASTMQKNLIALLRASLPTLREANAQGTRALAHELAVIRPYLEILKVRMEERLQTMIDVPEGLHSAEFPPMMLQSLVENAIKHGLEPKPEGGTLAVKAEVLHGMLALTVADTGLGFGKAATAGTGTGLANIRERLALLYGKHAQLTLTENQPSGTVATITVPYRLRTDAEGASA